MVRMLVPLVSLINIAAKQIIKCATITCYWYSYMRRGKFNVQDTSDLISSPTIKTNTVLSDGEKADEWLPEVRSAT